MLESIPLALISDVSAWIVAASVCITFVRLIYTGRLVPHSTVAMYIAALEAERAANGELRAALAEYQATGSATVHLLESIQSAAKKEDGQ